MMSKLWKVDRLFLLSEKKHPISKEYIPTKNNQFAKLRFLEQKHLRLRVVSTYHFSLGEVLEKFDSSRGIAKATWFLENLKTQTRPSNSTEALVLIWNSPISKPPPIDRCQSG